MGCGIMGCFRDRNNNGLITSEEPKIETISEFRLTEGMLVQQAEGYPEDTYDNIKVLGEGTFGTVYLGKHKISGVERAIKDINKDRANLSEEEEKTLIKEINILKTLDHPNIMKVYEYFNNINCFSIVSELCTGGELFKKLEDNHLSENVAKYVMKQLLSAVAFCHKNGIIHRDLKPENILLEEEEDTQREYFTIKVIDFGACGKIKKGQKYNEVIGTPFYIAPEVLKNKYDEKCDLWSCGVILYVMLCGEPPFYGDEDDEIYNQILTSNVTFSQDEWKNISREAIDLIQKLLTKDYKNRLSAEEALQHPWMKSMDTKKINFISIETLNQIVTNLYKYSAVQILQQASIAFIVHNLISRDMTKELRKCFIQFDTKGDGRLDKEELINGLKQVDTKKNLSEEVERVMKIIDVDGNGYIEYEEFLRASLDIDKILTPENVKIVFQLFDVNKTGKISPNELKKVMGHNADNISKEIWNDIVKAIDLNKDGVISFDEFDKMLDEVRSPTLS
jgi:calcium-dependent protein kinase